MVRRYRRGGGENEKKIDPLTDKPIEEKEDNAFYQDRIEKDGSYADSSEEEEEPKGGRRRRSRGRRSASRVPKGVHVKAKTLRRLLKSKGLKSSGKKATLRARARKAHLIGGSTCNTGVPASTAAGV